MVQFKMILGLTGGIASGKSTVSNYLKLKGLPVVDLDKIAHKVLGKNKPATKKLMKAFGKEFFVDGRLDRQLLGRYCFDNASRTELLNSIVHPYIYEEMEKQMEENKNAPILVLDAPLLIEAGLYKRCQKVMLVISSEETRIQRAIKRSNLSKLEVQKRMERQLSDEERKKYADYIIDNEGTIQETLKQIDGILKELNYE
ncbi:MAG: dephospho-CoA kinase [Clostridiales bacterium]|nr:dephospho-CoA kinase [Clostridiales bacterium]